jgi:hypothetical protein
MDLEIGQLELVTVQGFEGRQHLLLQEVDVGLD